MLNKKPGILIDVDKCTGCHACVVACRQESLISSTHPQKGAIEVLHVGPRGIFPDLNQYFLPTQCNHCEDPACLEICPTHASFQMEDGIVLIDHMKCSLCLQCISVCPYGARHFNEQTNRIEKCTFCVHRLKDGQDPACVSICPAKARIFGNLDDPHSEISRQIEDKGFSVFCLLKPDGGFNRSNILYVSVEEGRQTIPLIQKG